MTPNSNEACPSTDEDEPAPTSKKGDFSSVVGNGGEVDSEDEAPPPQKETPTEETPKASTDENDENFTGDESVTVLTALQDPDSRQKLAARLDAPDVVSAEEESRRNAVDVDGGAPNGGKVSSRQAEHVPATINPELASSDIAIIKTSGSGWGWSKIDMSVMEHGGVVPQEEDARAPIVVDMALLRRHGGQRSKEQDKFASIYSNGSRMIAQAIILRVNQPDADNAAKPKKLLIVPVDIIDPPQDDKADINGYATMMAIEPEVVRKLYMRDTPSKVLPSDFHPDQVDYVSLQSTHDFEKFVANHPKWSTLVSKKQSRAKSGGKRNKTSSDTQEPSQKTDASEAEDAPPPKKSKPEAQRTMTEFVAAGSASGTQEGATVSPVASPSKPKEVKKTTFRVVAPGNLAYVPVKLEALPEGTTELEITIAYITN